MNGPIRRCVWLLAVPLGALGAVALLVHGQGAAPTGDAAVEYTAAVRPLLKKYCLDCHSTKTKKGHLDLERFASVGQVRKDVKPWQQVIEQLDAGEMPPKERPQPTTEERRRLLDWTRRFLDAEAKARTGDPGRAPLRRLSNFEYDCTIRDLTGVDLKPTKEFPADGAAGEGFTNAAESLSDVTPALFSKYLAAAKEIAEHAVLLPDGFRFSTGKTRRDWTDESTARLRLFYSAYASGEGQVPLQPYLTATVRNRDALQSGRLTIAAAAAKDKLHPKYLAILWQALTDKTSSYPLDAVRERWRSASEKDTSKVADLIATWQATVWRTAKIGSYTRSEGAGFAVNLTRQQPSDPPAVTSVTLRTPVKSSPGMSFVALHMMTQEVGPPGNGHVVWHRPRFEAAGKPPILLRDHTKLAFGTHPTGKPIDDASLVTAAGTVTEVRLPAALVAGREFVVEARLDGEPKERVVLFRASVAVPGTESGIAVVAAPASAAYQRFLKGCAEFRQVFPRFVCFPPVVPTDEVVCLKMFHREDEPLERLFLDEAARRRLDRLWAEHRFVSRQPILENNYLPQFIGFVTQDQPKAMVTHFENQRPAFKERADAQLRDEAAALPKQLDALLDFAARANRRPLRSDERTSLLALYDAIRKKGTDHAEAFRGVLARVLVAPAFLFRIEKAPPGSEPRPVDDWELAARLSYFLWSSAPDDELRRLAAAGQLRDATVLEAQTRRLIQDERLRALAIEFGTQWIHVRGIDQLKEKNEKLFPTFDARLRSDINEEAIRFFQDLFQEDRAVTRLLDADYTYLNDNLARHYGIPGVTGSAWRRVEGVRKFGRGGILALGGVHAKQSGASRTSPVLRGNWVVETLLGEKLQRPPANVPVLPDVAGGTDQRTTRQLVERHVSDASCAACHVRIDPFGFAFEKYDPIGRLREKEAGGLPIDARAKLRDGTEFEGIDGLRNYLLTKKQDVIVRLFCQRLVGYALGRATTLSDTALIDQMVAELKHSDGRISAAVLAIVRSPQFRMIRSSSVSSDD